MFQSSVKLSWAVFFFLFCFATGRVEAQGTAANTTGVPVAQEVDAAELSFTSALITVDIPKLEQLLTDDFTWTHSHGGVEMKQEYLSGVHATRRYQAFKREGTSFRIYEKAVISSGIVHITVFTEDRGERTLDLSYTAIYVLQNGGWRLAAWHNTRLAQ